MENELSLLSNEELQDLNGGGTLGVIGGVLLVASACISGGGVFAVAAGVIGGVVSILESM